MHQYDLIMNPHPFFSGLCTEHLRTLARMAQRTQFRKGQFIFREGELANRFYLIYHGKVAIESAAGQLGTIPLQVLREGDVLGWSWLFPPYVWHFDARALDVTDATHLPGVQLRELCEMDSSLGYEIFKRISEVVVRRLQASRLTVLKAFGEADQILHD